MINFLQKGEIVTLAAAPEAVDSGEFIVSGALFGVAQTAADSGAEVPLLREGVFELPKATGTAWVQGDPLYWDASAKKFTTVGEDNKQLGVAWLAAASGDTTGQVSIGVGAAGGAANPVSSPTGGIKIVGGEVALDGTNPTPVVTGLTTITGVSITQKIATAPGVGTSVFTYTTSGGTLSIYAWKPTSNSDPTLIASTGTETVGYVVTGT